jgi:hypothetical protein
MEIRFWTVFHENIGMILAIHDPGKGHNVTSFTLLDLLLSLVQWQATRHEFVDGCHSIYDSCGDIFGQIDNSISAGA